MRRGRVKHPKPSRPLALRDLDTCVHAAGHRFVASLAREPEMLLLHLLTTFQLPLRKWGGALDLNQARLRHREPCCRYISLTLLKLYHNFWDLSRTILVIRAVRTLLIIVRVDWVTIQT